MPPRASGRVACWLTCTRWRVEAESDADLQSRQPLELSRTDRDPRECNRRALTAHVRCRPERPAALPASCAARVAVTPIRRVTPPGDATPACPLPRAPPRASRAACRRFRKERRRSSAARSGPPLAARRRCDTADTADAATRRRRRRTAPNRAEPRGTAPRRAARHVLVRCDSTHTCVVRAAVPPPPPTVPFLRIDHLN